MKLGLPTGTDPSKAASDAPTGATPPPEFTPPEPAKLADKFPQLEILGTAYTEYIELEARYTNTQRTAGSVAVIISPFRQEAQALLEQLWADLDGTLDEHQRALARRHLPLGRIFGTFQFGEPEVTIAISKTGSTFVYSTQFKWPDGSDGSGGDTSGGGSTLPPEYQRFWNKPATDE